MRTRIASLDCTDNGDGTVTVTGDVVRDGVGYAIDYTAPRMLLDALFIAAEREGALT